MQLGLDQKCESYIEDLDDALTIIAKLGTLYETLSRSDQKQVPRNVVERVVVNLEGKLERMDLLPPFAYLREVSARANGGEGAAKNSARIETGGSEATRSSWVLDCGQYRTRTYNLSHVKGTLCQLS